MRFKQRTITQILTAGINNFQGVTSIELSASLAKLPRLGIGELTPKPIKLRNDSVKIALGICKAALIIMTDIQFGRRCLRIIKLLFAPIALLAKIYTSCFIERTWPRTRCTLP